MNRSTKVKPSSVSASKATSLASSGAMLAQSGGRGGKAVNRSKNPYTKIKG